jgi:hypothetical protein
MKRKTIEDSIAESVMAVLDLFCFILIIYGGFLKDFYLILSGTLCSFLIFCDYYLEKHYSLKELKK